MYLRIFCFITLLCCLTQANFAQQAATKNKKSKPPTKAAVKKVVPQTEEEIFLGKGDGEKTCPVTGEPIDKIVTAQLDGRTIYLCCTNCKTKFEAHPERYVKPSLDYTKTTSKPHADVLATIQEIAVAQGFKVQGTHDLAASLRKAGIEREPYVVVEICNPQFASKVLAAEPKMGSLLPCRIAVYQLNNQTVVSTIAPTHLATLFPKPEIKEVAQQVDKILKNIIDTVTKPDAK